MEELLTDAFHQTLNTRKKVVTEVLVERTEPIKSFDCLSETKIPVKVDILASVDKNYFSQENLEHGY